MADAEGEARKAGLASALVSLKDSTLAILATPSGMALLCANLVPAGGIFFFGWDVGDLLLLYWGESVVIGCYTLIKLGVKTGRAILLLGPFFVLHFGGIMLWFLGVILAVDHELAKIATGSYQKQDYTGIAWSLAPALCAFVASHGVSFYRNFLGRREWEGVETRDMMFQPYRRVGPMLLMSMFAAFVVSAFGNLRWLFVLMIIVKVAFDLLGHALERMPDAGK